MSVVLKKETDFEPTCVKLDMDKVKTLDDIKLILNALDLTISCDIISRYDLWPFVKD
jgi:hypothetical protein